MPVDVEVYFLLCNAPKPFSSGFLLLSFLSVISSFIIIFMALSPRYAPRNNQWRCQQCKTGVKIKKKTRLSGRLRKKPAKLEVSDDEFTEEEEEMSGSESKYKKTTTVFNMLYSKYHYDEDLFKHSSF